MGFVSRRIAKRAEQYKSVDDYLKDLWRPLMAWVYAVVVLFDFMIAPIMLGIYCAVFRQPYIEWKSLTIQGGGMFHIAMGAVIGVSSYSHSQEKINGAPGGDSGMPGMPAWPSNTPGSPGYTGNAPASGGGYGTAGGFGSTASTGFGSTPSTSSFGPGPAALLDAVATGPSSAPRRHRQVLVYPKPSVFKIHYPRSLQHNYLLEAILFI